MYKKILENNVFTVSEYIEFLNNVLSNCNAKIEGEVYQLKKSSLGHIYFSLKDKNGSILNCIIWNYHYRMCGINLEEGMHIIITGKPNVYAPSGRLSFVASFVELVGDGALKKQYEELKARLEKQGAFKRKLEIRKYPKVIGVITSKHGEVIHDFLNNLGKYNFKIEFIDSRVEGGEALEDLIFSIKTFKKRTIDCLVVIRGGGAKNAFDIFNNEALIREIIDYPYPVISGLGHHQDETLFAMASDYSVSTPTAAAHLLNSSWDALMLEIKKQEHSVFEKFNTLLNATTHKLETTEANILNIFSMRLREIREEVKHTNFEKFNTLLNATTHKLETTEANILNIFSMRLKEIKEKVIHIKKQINYCNPKKQLKLGYSILRKDNKIIKSIKNISKDDLIDLELLDGIIKSKVYEKKPR